MGFYRYEFRYEKRIIHQIVMFQFSIDFFNKNDIDSDYYEEEKGKETGYIMGFN